MATDCVRFHVIQKEADRCRARRYIYVRIDIIGTLYVLLFYFLQVFEVENKYYCINSVMAVVLEKYYIILQ